MAQKKFTELVAGSDPDGTEILAGVQGGASKRFTVNQIAGGRFRGAWDASGDVLPSTTVGAGDSWYFSVAGTFDGEEYPVGTIAIALIATPGQTLSNWRLF